MKKTPIINCPTCQKPLPYNPENPFRPFCCERCRLIDLGAWAAAEHVIAGDDLLSDEFIDDIDFDNPSKKLH